MGKIVIRLGNEVIQHGYVIQRQRQVGFKINPLNLAGTEHEIQVVQGTLALQRQNKADTKVGC